MGEMHKMRTSTHAKLNVFILITHQACHFHRKVLLCLIDDKLRDFSGHGVDRPGVKNVHCGTIGGNVWTMIARLKGSSVSWKSNNCLCILTLSVASMRATEDIYLPVGGCVEEGKRKAMREKQADGHLREACRPET